MADNYNTSPPWIRKHRIGPHTSQIRKKTEKPTQTEKPTLLKDNLGHEKERCTTYFPYTSLIPIDLLKEQKPNYTSRYLQKNV